MPVLVETDALTKRYKNQVVLENVSIAIEEGSIVGLLGPNGAGKSTLIQCILGLLAYEGQCRTLGRDPRRSRHLLMENTTYVPDQLCLPLWLSVEQLLQFMCSIHPRFSESEARRFLNQTEIKGSSKLYKLSKGMLVQLHLALALATDSQLLILDEPTLGLDVTRRKEFWKQIINDYSDGKRTLIIATHLIQEVEHLVSHLILINHGRITLNQSMDSVLEHYQSVLAFPGRAQDLRAMNPVKEQEVFGRTVFLFEGRSPRELAQYGEIHQTHLTDIFEAATQRDPS
ncbi:MAG: ABC transporter ATP-binding protein [Gammaproteobacteria bacterium]